MSLPRQTPQVKTADSKRGLTEKELKGKKKVIDYYEAQTEICKKFTGKTILTGDEYQKSFTDFKRLVDIARNKGEPIYILPEFSTKDKLHPYLQKLKNGIVNGTPYAELIADNLGTTWPALLRLYYGLSSGFKISGEQFHSMLKVCYWKALGLTVESVPLFEYGETSDLGEILVNSEFYFPDKSIQPAQFKHAMKSQNIPSGEKYLTVVKLNQSYFHALRYILENNTNVNISDISMVDDMGVFYPGKPKYNIKSTESFLQTEPAMMFGAPFVIYTGYFRMTVVGVPTLIFPSQTMEQVYFKTVNPLRDLKIVRLLGRYSTKSLETLNDHNERAVNLYAPGITNPLLAHGKVINPATGLLHDEYHFGFEATLSNILAAQMNRGIKVIRDAAGDDKILTSEILRLLDRETHPEQSDNERFYHLLKYIFALDNQNPDSASSISAILLIVDMVLSPAHWPSFKAVRDKLLKQLLPPVKISPNMLEEKIRAHAAKLDNNIGATAASILCDLYYNDTHLSNLLIELHRAHPGISFHAWKKLDHAHLHLIFSLPNNDQEYNFTDLANAKKRTNLIQQFKKSLNTALFQPIKSVSVTTTTVEETKPAADEIEIPIPELDDNKIELINHLHGKLTQQDGGVSTVKIQSSLLNNPVREVLGIDRVNMYGVIRCGELARQGIIVEPIKERANWFQLTFMRSQRALVNTAQKTGDETPSMTVKPK